MLTSHSGHYDLAYTLQDLPPAPAPAPASVPTYFQYASQPYHEPAYDLGVSDALAMIPGMSYANPQHGWMSSSSYSDSELFPTPGPPIQSCAPVGPTPATPAPQSQLPHQAVYVPPTPTQLVAPPNHIQQDFTLQSVPLASTQAHPIFQHQPSGPFRHSAWEYEPGFAQAMFETPFQTTIFKK